MDDRILLPVTGDRPMPTARGSALAATHGAELAVCSVANDDEGDIIRTTQGRTGIKHDSLRRATGRALELSNTSRTRVLQE
jgi:hypothetical protein